MVITGAAGGIGSALARALRDRGARLLLTDLDGDRVAGVAAELDVAHVAGDVGDGDDVATLVQTARAVLGGVDLFCGNAGVAVPGSLESDAFEVSWRVNLLGHVHAARELLPGWLDAGRGRYLATVSAAGLLTMLGNAPYSVTKHAALAFAEWLRMTYAHRGITVQALCPQGVRTAHARRRRSAGPRPSWPRTHSAPARSPRTRRRRAGLDQFLILPHPEVAEYARRRATDPDRWLGRHEPRPAAGRTGPTRRGRIMTAREPTLDLTALQRYLDRRIDLTGPLTAELLAGGKSNLTFLLDDGTHSWVVRRPPLGHVLATAHDMAPRVPGSAALAHRRRPGAGNALCTDPEVLGAPFYVMDHVDGTVDRDARAPAALAPGPGARR